MPRRGNGEAASSKPSAGGRLGRVAGAVKRVFTRSKPVQMDVDTNIEAPMKTKGQAQPSRSGKKAGTAKARVAQRQSDIPLDVLNNTYTPRMASHKEGFRSDGADHQRDQEFATGTADERWNDEDRITNKSGDPRIGTHNRTYEPGEARAESRNE